MRYLGIDFGLRRIGLATSEGHLAAPLKVIEVTGFKDALKKVLSFIKSEEFDQIIVGLPEGKIGQTVLGFVKALKQEKMNVECMDETLSSQKAIANMIALNVSKNKRRISDDYSAAIILQDYLDEKI